MRKQVVIEPTRSTVQVDVLPREVSDSGWYAALADVAPAVRLNNQHTCDWLIVGGGFFGLSAAQRLAELRSDDRITLIDAGRIGNNASGRCAGYAIDLAHNPRNPHFAENEQGNREEAALNREGIAYMQDAVDKYTIDCDWRPQGKIHAAASGRGERCLRDFATAMDRIGEPYEWYDAARMRALFGSDYYRLGLFAPGTVLLQPAAYLRGVLNNLADNVSVFEDSPIVEVHYGKDRHICTTREGSIKSRNIIFANNGFLTYFGFFSGTAIPVYTYGSLTRPLTESEQQSIGGESSYGLIPADSFGTTVRRTVDQRLFIRNIYSYEHNFHSSSSMVARARKNHQRSFDARYPSISHIGFEHSWGGALALAQNGGSVFGRIADRVFAACFCNGTGVSKGVVQGKAIAEYACGNQSASIDILLKRARPNKTHPRVLLEPGVKMTTRWRLFRAGREV